MKKDESSSYQVEPGLCLTLEDLFAEVSISVGEEDTAAIKISGDEKLIKDIKISQANPKSIQVKGNGLENGRNVTVITGGSRTSINSGNIIITGRDGMVSVSKGKSTIIINGKVVSGEGDVIEGGIPQIQVIVPKGTDLEIYDVEKAESIGLGGKLVANLGGQGNLRITESNGLKIKCDGQSKCKVEKATGDAKLTVSGQSTINVQGDLNDVEANASGKSEVTIIGNCHDFNGDASGLSEITIIGNCHDFNGDASGLSEINVTGKAAGRIRQRESGQSEIHIR
jgi:hypothetical protein